MIMYRVESYRDRNGVYQGGAAQRALLYMEPLDGYTMQSTLRPSPHSDELMGGAWDNMEYAETQNYLFGFVDKVQYLEWFEDEVGREAVSSTHVLAVYDCERYIVGDKQMVAHREHMVHLHDLHTHTLHEVVKSGE